MSRFDGILGAAASQQGKGGPKGEKDADVQNEFWSGLKKADRKASIKLSVSVPLALNEKIEDKARDAGISKNELINRMLEYLLE